MLAQFIGVQVVRAQRRRDEWMDQGKTTSAWSRAFQVSVELSTEAVMRSEDVLCVCLGDAGACERDGLFRVFRKRHKVHAQAQVYQEHFRCKFQEVGIYAGGYVLQVYTLHVSRHTRQGHLRMHTASAQRTCHGIGQEVQGQGACVECVQAFQLYAIVATPPTIPCTQHAVYFDLFAYTVEYVALDSAVCRMQHHRHRLVLDTIQLHRRRRQIHTHAVSGALVNIHETLDCNCFS